LSVVEMESRRLVVGPIEANCYILWDRSTRNAVVIDPGGDKDRIVEAVEALELSVERILLTHGHFDHAFYAADLARRWHARIGMHRADVPQLAGSLEVGAIYYDLSEHITPTPDDFFADGDQFTLGEATITVLHTPGHSEGGVCYRTDIGVFCGDTLFAGSVGRSDFPGGSFEKLIRSIRDKILTLDDAVPLYPGHGPATTVGAERRNNPFLR